MAKLRIIRGLAWGPFRHIAERFWGRTWLQAQLGAAVLIQILQPGRVRAEDHVDYRFGFYGEDNGRIEVSTHSVLFEKKLSEAITAKGELIYDGISGASPTGTPPLPGTKKVPLATLEDIRRAGNLAFDVKWGRQTLTPQIAYSKESDYESTGLSLNDAIEFNQKNTTLRVGVAHNFDVVEPNFFSHSRNKDTTDFLIGLSQLLSAKTILTADFTFGFDDGYLADPYRGVQFSGYPLFEALFPEKRPNHREREVLALGLTQFIEPANGSVEASYRFYHDSFGIWSHTATVSWFQKIGSRVVLSPMFRYYFQTAADFYAVSFPGDPTLSMVGIPKHYSADYRLSRMETFTYGLQATARIADWLSLDAGYQRYEMFGLDGKTSTSAYPKAHIVNVGLRIWF